VSSVRRLTGAGVVATLCLVVAACTSDGAGGPGRTPSPSIPDPTALSTDRVTLRFSVYGNDEEVASYVELAESFTKNHPHVKIKVDHAADADTAMADLATGSENGDPPDVFLMEHETLPALMRDDLVQPVHALLEERQVDFGDGYQRDAVEAFSAESALQCMPHGVSPLVVYYNQDLLDFASLVEPGEEPPTAEDGWTWEQFAQAARQMSRGRTKGVYIEPTLEQLAPFIWSGGGELVDDMVAPTTLTLSDGDTRAALEQVLTLARDPQVTPTRAELGRMGAVAAFRKGRLGMVLGTRALTPALRESEHLDFEVMPLPSLGRYRTIAQLSGYCISSQSQDVPAAADFLAYAVGREGATITTLSGYVVPSNLQVAHSPAFGQPGKRPDNAFVFNEGVRRAERPPFVPQWPDVMRQTEPSLARMFYAPVIDLETLLADIDLVSQRLLAPQEPPVED
jgi:multiple sugar transport system substrate-binding protein